MTEERKMECMGLVDALAKQMEEDQFSPEVQAKVDEQLRVLGALGLRRAVFVITEEGGEAPAGTVVCSSGNVSLVRDAPDDPIAPLVPLVLFHHNGGCFGQSIDGLKPANKIASLMLDALTANA